LTLSQVIDREFTDPRLKSLFCNIWGYYGLPPSRLSFQLFAVANASYIKHGPYHVKGTSQALSNAFVDAIEENGGHVHLRDGVKKINVDGQKVTGVVTDEGEEVEADFILSNANPIHACYELIGADKVPGAYLKSLAEGRIALSTVNVYMGLDCTAEELGSRNHEIMVSTTYDDDESYRRMFTTGKPLGWGITNYNVADPDFSPPGTCVVVLTAPCDYGAWVRVPPDRYVDTKNRIAAELIEASEEYLPGLKSHIEVIEVSTPITNMRYSGNPGGSYLGFDFSVTGSSMLRPPNRGPLEGLFFANAWVRMGGGMETCMASGLLAFGEIMKDVKGVKGPAKYMPAFG
jgi:prolycopene isomerase